MGVVVILSRVKDMWNVWNQNKKTNETLLYTTMHVSKHFNQNVVKTKWYNKFK